MKVMKSGEQAAKGVAGVPRRTVIKSAEWSGAGLFTGKPSRVRVLPAAAGHGIVFARVDLPGAPLIPASVHSVGAAPEGVPARNTTLRVGGVAGAGDAACVTVEHLMSALAGLGITDVLVEVEGVEIPILDGSAAPFVEGVWKAGVRYAGEQVEPLVVLREIRVEGAGGASVTARPREGGGCVYTYELDFGGGPIAAQSATYDSARGDYAKEVAPARTFCTKAEAEAMQRAGLFAGLTARDMLVIGESGPIENQYRFENEPARHKLLDLIGDLGVVGRPIVGEIVARKSGHALNGEMARALVAG